MTAHVPPVEELPAADAWRLASLTIEFQKWGKDAGKYAGKITFQNGEHESFTFNVRPDMAEPYINLIAKDVVLAAETLGERLITSMNLRERVK